MTVPVRRDPLALGRGYHVNEMAFLQETVELEVQWPAGTLERVDQPNPYPRQETTL